MSIKAQTLALLAVAGGLILMGADSKSATASATPVLVELFTSEGCSDCPPADALLAKIDREQPVRGAQAIVLSEHVDYWDHQGWADPFSSPLFTRRQEEYGDRFHLNSVYTPQMVVNGGTEFVGSDASKASAAIEKAARENPVALSISVNATAQGKLRFHLKSGAVREAADLIAVIALESASSDVRAGENSGRKLSYVAVAESMTKLASLRAGEKLEQDFSLSLASSAEQQLRLIAFLQDRSTRRVLGAAMQRFAMIQVLD